MKTLEDLYTVIKKICEDEMQNEQAPLPIFSFEGLPGAGKTTQIKLVAEKLSQKYGKIHYIDLPSSSPIGSLLKKMYSDTAKWHDICKDCPWFNTLMISADLRAAISQAKQDGAICALMSRGIISTYYYNYAAYEAKYSDPWEQLEKHLRGFYRPTAIVFLEITEKIAHNRVVQRNRGPLRKMDSEEQMKQDKEKLKEYINTLSNTPVHYINAEKEKAEVTDSIIEIIGKYL